MKRLALFAASCVLATACKTAEPAPAPAQASAPAPAPAPVVAEKPMPPGLDLAAMDPAVDPCDDFYEYACGGWMRATEIPADQSRWSRGFNAIQSHNEEVLKGILASAAEGKGGDVPGVKLLGDFYGACMDEAQAEAALPALKKQLARFASVKDAKGLARAVAGLHTRGLEGLFHFDPAQDLRDATQVIGEVDQGGLGLEDRDYYLKDDAKTKEVRDAYADHVKRIFELLGEKPAAAAAKSAAVMAIETKLAQASMSRVDRRDPEKLYHRLERAGLKKTAPAFPWDVYFAEVGAKDVQALNVVVPAFFTEVDSLVKTVKPADWNAYLTFHLVSGSVLALPKRFQDEDFRFNSKALTGAAEDQPRWKKCVQMTDELVPHALAQPFIAQTFGADGKATTSQMVSEVEGAFERNLDSLAWMDAQTRAQALVKVRKIVNKIGYPDEWRSYERLKVVRASFLTSMYEAQSFERARKLAKIGKPVERGEWLMSPPTVNAYYNPPYNEIVFPAGILQPPFFNREASPAVNFGAIGMVVGHEITHGFDDEGRQFDADGNLKTWWTEGSDKAFRERVACVKNQYDALTAVDELKVNGALTLGENVADLGGLKLAHAAMEAWLAKNGEAKAQAESYRFSPSQQFFLGYAQSWCSKWRNAFARARALTDPHSPPFLRVNAPLSNLPAFQQAFQCKEGAKMLRPAATRCEVW
ncbi:M13 family metallopeptidase [Myxococcaceae bacterium GXIMD 01537]